MTQRISADDARKTAQPTEEVVRFRAVPARVPTFRGGSETNADGRPCRAHGSRGRRVRLCSRRGGSPCPSITGGRRAGQPAWGGDRRWAETVFAELDGISAAPVHPNQSASVACCRSHSAMLIGSWVVPDAVRSMRSGPLASSTNPTVGCSNELTPSVLASSRASAPRRERSFSPASPWPLRARPPRRWRPALGQSLLEMNQHCRHLPLPGWRRT